MIDLKTFLVFTISFLTIFIVKTIVEETNLDKKSKDKVLCIYSFCLLTFLAGFRNYTVGVDTKQFYDAYIEIDSLSFPYSELRYEIGYSLFTKALTFISPNPNFFLFISSLLINLGFIYFIYKNSTNVPLSIGAYILTCAYFQNMNTLRNFLGLVPILLTFHLLKKKKVLPYILACIVGGLFHKVNYAFLCFAIIPYFKNIKPFIKLIGFLALILFIGGNSLLFPLINLTPFSSYLTYLGGSYLSPSLRGGFVYSTLPVALVIIYFLSYKKENYALASSLRTIPNVTYTYSYKPKFIKENYIEKNLKNLLLLLVLMFSLFQLRWEISVRITIILIPFSLILFPNYFINDSLKDFKEKLYFLVLIGYFLVVFILQPSWFGVQDYTTSLFKLG